jgi:hypothetical protein
MVENVGRLNIVDTYFDSKIILNASDTLREISNDELLRLSDQRTARLFSNIDEDLSNGLKIKPAKKMDFEIPHS